MKITALIMAGGRGERFWPRSRVSLPKQFLSLTDDNKTMLQLTVERILPLVELEDIYIATGAAYRDLAAEQLPGLPPENILCEPVGRNTAPCIGLGAAVISRKYEDAVMMVLPSDHLIQQTAIFTDILRQACDTAQAGTNLVTIGISPDRPDTGYGYIRYLPDVKHMTAYAVDRFVEKPCLELAEQYLASGDYLWNSGMFVWKVSSILQNLKTLMPSLYEGLMTIRASLGTADADAVLQDVFPGLPSQSIDYGVMEKAANIYIIPGSFGWDDVGSWPSLARIKDTDAAGNVLRGNVTAVESEGCVMESSGKLLAAVGLTDMIVIDTPDATLICPKGKAGDIKKLLAQLRAEGKDACL